MDARLWLLLEVLTLVVVLYQLKMLFEGVVISCGLAALFPHGVIIVFQCVAVWHFICFLVQDTEGHWHVESGGGGSNRLLLWPLVPPVACPRIASKAATEGEPNFPCLNSRLRQKPLMEMEVQKVNGSNTREKKTKTRLFVIGLH